MNVNRAAYLTITALSSLTIFDLFYHNMNHTLNIALISLFVLGMTLGCGGGRKPIKTDYVEGTVTYNGAPVSSASINFSPARTGEGSPAYGFTDNSGTYKIQTFLGAPDRGTTPGEYIVTVSKTESFSTGRFTTDEDGNRFEEYNTRSVLPEIYNNAGTSPLRATVTSSGPNNFDFDLVDEP